MRQIVEKTAKNATLILIVLISEITWRKKTLISVHPMRQALLFYRVRFFLFKWALSVIYRYMGKKMKKRASGV